MLKVAAPAVPLDYEQFWHAKYANALTIHPMPRILDTGVTRGQHRVFEIQYTSTNDFKINGWLCLPTTGRVNRGFVVSHGYAGREGPDYHLPFSDSAILFPCCRGLSRSAQSPISTEPKWHVLHDIDKKDQYIIGGCVEDIWLAVSALIRLFPNLQQHIGFLGISFGGGVGAMAVAWDKRISKAHFNIPSFGNQPLRLELATTGSADSVQNFYKQNKQLTLNTLSYYDAAIAAKFITIPTHTAAALFDPMVAPPGQFSIYNAIRDDKSLFVLEAGHHDYPNKQKQDTALLKELDTFFNTL
ncbi:acetylxylan esterase [Catenovulum maritimum]|uniref:acetylxylan esterase n=1 Tax=Catenovulum maritimum TaxID=1513271 RepID=UPI000A97958B|nr:acetylxylan esterase [Catenovulum maritimum]